MKIYLVRWTTINDVYDYYPCAKAFINYDKARDYQGTLIEEQEKQYAKINIYGRNTKADVPKNL